MSSVDLNTRELGILFQALKVIMVDSICIGHDVKCSTNPDMKCEKCAHSAGSKEIDDLRMRIRNEYYESMKE